MSAEGTQSERYGRKKEPQKVETVEYGFATCERVHEIMGIRHNHRGPCGKWPIGWHQEVPVGAVVEVTVDG